jgi:PASTA domain-containing protein
VSAPVFKRIAEQVLEYLHVPHDVDVKRQTLRASTKPDDETDESSDRLGAGLQIAEADAVSNDKLQRNVPSTTPALNPEAQGVTAQAAQPQVGTELAQMTAPPPTQAELAAAAKGTVVLDVDSGVVVPSFLGKPLRSAVESAQQSGLEINAIGSGVAREQWPAPGRHLPSGQKITVRFTH